jgi:hypothetical protein
MNVPLQQVKVKVYVPLVPRPCLSFRENKDWGHSFLGTGALFIFFPRFPLSVSWYRSFVCLFCPAVAFCGRSDVLLSNSSDRPRLYENQSDLPPNPYSLEKTGARDE